MKIPNGRRARKTESRASAGSIRPLGAKWMPASRWRVPVALSALAAGAALAAPAVASASPLPSPVTGHVYLDDSTAGANTIAAFDRHADGSLTPLPGSPFAAGGAGAGAGLASEGAVQIADGGRFLLAVDAGSNQVSVLRIQPDGSLRLASVVSSGGVLPVSVAVHGDREHLRLRVGHRLQRGDLGAGGQQRSELARPGQIGLHEPRRRRHQRRPR